MTLLLMISKTVGSGLLELKTKPSVATSILKTNNKSMKTKIFALLAVLVMFAGVMTSCDKSDYEPMAPVISNDDVSSSVRGELRSLSDFALEHIVLIKYIRMSILIFINTIIRQLPLIQMDGQEEQLV